MQALILAGGDGSRLAAGGVSTPKPLVPVHGVPQLARLAAGCRRSGCESITCVVRADLALAVAAIAADAGVHVVPVRTPTSLHSLQAGLVTMAPGPVFCVLVDTVMTDADWDAVQTAAIARLSGVDAVVATTSFIRDEQPLWADVAADGMVRAFGKRGGVPAVTGGAYWFGTRARDMVAPVVAAGTQRLRGYLAALVESGAAVAAVDVARIIDVDTRDDLADADAMFLAAGA